uniref:Uncharacterized protein n=1 Tax=Daphnia galeata TaxID=27404 RepID=A0A8J2RXK8_9CRUS|nr:unnamed protein product [Daphnia galeata]
MDELLLEEKLTCFNKPTLNSADSLEISRLHQLDVAAHTTSALLTPLKRRANGDFWHHQSTQR